MILNTFNLAGEAFSLSFALFVYKKSLFWFSTANNMICSVVFLDVLKYTWSTFFKSVALSNSLYETS